MPRSVIATTRALVPLLNPNTNTMTNTDGIIKSLETLIKHEKAIQRQGDQIEEIKNVIQGTLQTIQGLIVVNAVLTREIENLRNNKPFFGLN